MVRIKIALLLTHGFEVVTRFLDLAAQRAQFLPGHLDLLLQLDQRLVHPALERRNARVRLGGKGLEFFVAWGRQDGRADEHTGHPHENSAAGSVHADYGP